MEYIKPERIKELRKKLNLSQKSLGIALGVSDRAVSKWENGISKPSAKNLIGLAKIADISLDSMLLKNDSSVQKPQSTGMESLKELYKIGRGPSSSHTIGPENACRNFKSKNNTADKFEVILYGSLAKTGKGHGTDTVIKKTLDPINCEITFNLCESNLPHPNTMDIFAYKKGKIIDSVRVMSVGGGSILYENETHLRKKLVYPHTSFSEIATFCRNKSIRLWQYVEEFENADLSFYLQNVWKQMNESIKNGINDEGLLPGGLHVQKKAKSLFNNQHIDETPETKEDRLICAYAFAVSEQNASGEKIVTAPTCGASGVLPSVLYYQQQKNNFSDDKIIQALKTAGLIGNLIKTNASISGAECGCQAEIGTACAMAAAALGELFDLNIEKIEYAAEIAIEHHLGLTCDPICGFVQIPCIERNAVAAMRALNAIKLSSLLWDTRKISFDRVVQTMKETGLDLSSQYKETSEAGLAKIKL